MEAFTVIAEFFQTGGGFMYPILVVLALGVSIGLERYFYLQRTHRSTQRVWSQLVPMLKAQDFDRLVTATEESRSALAQVLNYGFARLGGTRKREDIESAMEEGLMEVLPKLEQRTHYLATFANIATLLGLLGTIIGLIQAFTAVANANPAEKADMLSASISVAMNTTAFGLIVAIPLLLTHTYLQTKTTALSDSLEMATVKCLNLITREA